ncbi:ArsR/SmtB family transcription factor [Bombiscardovia coagulans]|uniref:ArsR family transcriptional regulator n=1 Tax=Bombiscardovia coagulans TaxID=686666 RepID=A0A261EPK4_9BIFI|nr:helix-turn-helix domain-containing protein [Bombiscardovia coagulans]OZG48785.1 ArsR family transcriptional regulator [Bombiscardovia coagulans]
MKNLKEISDVGAFKALSNPLRMRIYYLLQSRESATAVELADTLGLDSVLVSYHLRKLEHFDFVTSRSTGLPYRQKLWEPTSRGFIDASGGTDNLGDSVGQAIVSNDNAHLRTFLEGFDEETNKWKNAAFITDHLLTLNAEQMVEFREELMALLDRWKSKSTSTKKQTTNTVEADAKTDDARKILVMAYGFPFIP